MLWLLPGMKTGISGWWVLVPVLCLMLFLGSVLNQLWWLAGVGAGLTVLTSIVIGRADLRAYRRSTSAPTH